MDEALDRIVGFLRGIGIAVHECDVAGEGFLPGVCIRDGGLLFDRHTLASPGDLLHEAGHVAVTPASMRHALGGALPVEASAPFAGETEAIAWSWAALVSLGLPAEVLFHDRGYRGQAASLRLAFTMGVWPGAFGLAQAGLTTVGPATTDGPPRYPCMVRWLRG